MDGGMVSGERFRIGIEGIGIEGIGEMMMIIWCGIRMEWGG